MSLLKQRTYSSNYFYLSAYLLIACLYFSHIFVKGIIVLPEDAYLFNYPAREFYAQALKNFEFPLWNNYEFAGIPFVGAVQTGALYPPNLALYFLLPAPYAYVAGFIGHFALAAFFTFLYARLLGLTVIPAFTAGLLFGFSGFLISHKPHTAILNTAAWLPLALYLFERLRSTLEFRYAAFAALAIGIQVFAGNFQICVYTYIVLLVFVVTYISGLDVRKRTRFALLCLFSLVAGLLIASPQIYEGYRFSGISFRATHPESYGYAFFSAFHMYISMLPAFIFPFFFGGGEYGGPGWGPYDSVVPFIGTFPLILAGIVFFYGVRSDRNVRFFGALACIGFLLALGDDTLFNRLFYYVPVYNQFRGHSKNLLEFSLAVAMLSGIGLNSILHYKGGLHKHLQLSLLLLGTIMAVSSILIYVLPAFELKGIFAFFKRNNFIDPYMLKKALSFSNPVVYVPFTFICFYILTGLVAFKKEAALKYLLPAIVLMEAYSYGGFHEMDGVKFSDIGPYRTWLTKALSSLKTDGQTRALMLGTECLPNISMSKGIGNLQAYDAFVPAEYSRLLKFHPEGIANEFNDPYDFLLRNNIMLNMLSVKHVIMSPEWKFDFTGYGTSSGYRPPSVAKDTIPHISRTGNAISTGNGVVISGEHPGQKGYLSFSAELEKGTYLISFKAKAAASGKPFLVLYALEPLNKETRNIVVTKRMMVVYPDEVNDKHYAIITTNRGEFTGVMTNDVPGTWHYSVNYSPIVISDLKLSRLDNYAPPGMSAGPAKQETGAPYRKKAEYSDFSVYENVNALPKAFFISEIVPAADFNEIMKTLYTRGIDPTVQALVLREDIDGIGQSHFSPGKVSVRKYSANAVSIDADFKGQGFIVLSDQYYPGWKAFIDGKETKVYKVNGILRGVVSPEGKHTIEFKYRPYIFFILLGLSSLLIILFCSLLFIV